MDTKILIDKLIKAASFKYREDQTAPGITVAYLCGKQQYYCSLVRYAEPFRNTKTVLCKAEADTLEKALKDVASQFLQINARSQDPIQELAELIWIHNDS